jgi:prevent-host-death family protein
VVRDSLSVADFRLNGAGFDLAKYLGYDRNVKRVKIGEFRDRASELIRRAAEGETIVILHRDREVAKVVPISADKGRGSLIGCLARTAEVPGNIEAPIAPSDDWFRHSK